MHKNILVSRLLMAAVFLLPFRIALAEEDLPVARNTQFSIGIESFKMEDRVLSVKAEEESGLRAAVGIGWSNLFIPSEGSIFRANLTVYGGMPDYTCVLCGPGFTSTSKYAGLKLEGMGGYRFGSIVGMEVFSGVSADFWYHGIKESATIAAFDEYFGVASAKFGISFLQRFSKFGYFVRVGVKAPFVAWNHVDYLDGADVKPVPRLSGFAELNFTFGNIPRDRFVLSLYYDTYRFGQSKPVNITNGGVPAGTYASLETDYDTFGIQAIFGF